MKILIASDIHGSSFWMKRLFSLIEQEKPQKIVLLGDYLYHGPRNSLGREYDTRFCASLLNEIASKYTLVAVRGNCDSEVDQVMLDFPCMSDYALVDCENFCLFATHGHIYSPDFLPNFIKDDNYVFASGHTHVKDDSLKNGVRCINPGSVSIPRDGDNNNSCVIFDFDDFKFVNL